MKKGSFYDSGRPKLASAGLLMTAALVVGCSSDDDQPRVVARSIIEGTILTMNPQNAIAEAVAIDDRGVILAVGKAEDLRNDYLGAATQVRKLNPKETLLPGLIDAHMHLIPFITAHSSDLTDVGPCLPGPYSQGNTPNCSNFIRSSLQRMRPAACSASGGVLLGLDLDPSRQPYDEATPSAVFRASPRTAIEQEVCVNQPVLIIDQSGHLGYVNQAAFDALQAFRTRNNLPWPPQFVEGGAWALSATPNAPDNSKYSGLLIEQEAYTPFVQMIGATDPGFKGQILRDPVSVVQAQELPVITAVNALRDAGVTTVVSIADTRAEADAVAATALLPGSPIRALRVVRPPAVAAPPQGYGNQPQRAACDPRTDAQCALPQDLGFDAIKLTVDGSTQGCTAAMQEPILYSPTGPCAKDAGGNDNARGYADFESADQIAATLAPFWQTGQWRFEIHTNGNRAMKMALDAYATLQQQQSLPHRVSLVHATVGDAAVFRQIAELRSGKNPVNGASIPALDVRLTHLIGHVAYWGGAFESILGPEAAAQIDPIGALDIPLGIPYTLHSDATVSLPRPLWFVRQAVSRETWFYPELSDQDKKILGPQNRISVQEALRAVTISTAQEKELDGWLGSIEPGKVADFVLLSDNPLNHEPGNGGDVGKITDIKVVDTFINGKATTALK